MQDQPQDEVLQGLRSGIFLLYAVLGVVFALIGPLGDSADAAMTAKLEAEARERKAVRPEEICISRPKHPGCVADYRGAIKNVPTPPLQDTK